MLQEDLPVPNFPTMSRRLKILDHRKSKHDAINVDIIINISMTNIYKMGGGHSKASRAVINSKLI